MNNSIVPKTHVTFQLCALLITGIVLVSTSLYAASTWDGSESSSFGVADNWTPSGVPGSADEAVINNASVPNLLTIVDGDVIEINRLTVRVSGICYMNGGTLGMVNASGRWRVGWRNGDDSYMTVRGGTINTIYTLQICEDKGAYGYLSISNATVSIGRGITCGAVAGTGTGGEATMIIEPGTTFSCSSLGSYESQVRPNGRMMINGGVLNCNAALNVYTGGVVWVNNGTVQATDLTIQGASDNGLVDVSKGTIEISSNIVTKLQGYVSVQKLTGYGGIGSVVISYDGGSGITSVTAIPEPAVAGLLMIGLFGMAVHRRTQRV